MAEGGVLETQPREGPHSLVSREARTPSGSPSVKWMPILGSNEEPPGPKPGDLPVDLMGNIDDLFLNIIP